MSAAWMTGYSRKVGWVGQRNTAIFTFTVPGIASADQPASMKYQCRSKDEEALLLSINDSRQSRWILRKEPQHTCTGDDTNKKHHYPARKTPNYKRDLSKAKGGAAEAPDQGADRNQKAQRSVLSLRQMDVGGQDSNVCAMRKITKRPLSTRYTLSATEMKKPFVRQLAPCYIASDRPWPLPHV